jgi:hypothetical protein
MATPILNQVSKDLADKLQDPVASGSTSGVRVTAEKRLYYIIQGYRQLLRFITLLYPELITKIFTEYYSIAEETTDDSGLLFASAYADVHQVYAKEPNDETYIKAEFVEQNIFQDVKLGQNKFYLPDLNTKNYFWSLIANKIVMAPDTKYKLSISGRKEIATSLTYNGATDLDIPLSFEDIILNMSASQAYLDLGQPELSAGYKQAAQDEIKVLVAGKQEKENEDED